jgi:hypothetical protein
MSRTTNRRPSGSEQSIHVSAPKKLLCSEARTAARLRAMLRQAVWLVCHMAWPATLRTSSSAWLHQCQQGPVF